jgi:hypothetical protein
MTTIGIENEEGGKDEINENVIAVERAVGHTLKRCNPVTKI